MKKKPIRSFILRRIPNVRRVGSTSLILLLFVLAFQTPAHSQIDTKVTLSENLQNHKERAKVMKKNYSDFRKEYKKRIRLQTGTMKKTIDSLKELYSDKKTLRREINEAESQNMSLSPNQRRALDFLKNQDDKGEIGKTSKRKIKKYLEQEIEFFAAFDDYRKNLSHADGSLQTYQETADAYEDSATVINSSGSRTDQQIDEWAASQDELNPLQQQANAEEMKASALPEFDHPMQHARQAGMKHFENESAKINEAVAALDKYKKKFRYVTDSEEIVKGVDNIESRKINSLKGEPFLKRLQWSGDFHIEIGKPLWVDFNPGVAYRINKDWNLGVGGMIRSQIEGENISKLDYQFPLRGVRLFSERRIWRSFSAHFEYEYLKESSSANETNGKEASGSHNFNAGIAKSFNIWEGIKGNAMLLYNFNLNDNAFYRSPWIVRFGFGN